MNRLPKCKRNLSCEFPVHAGMNRDSGGMCHGKCRVPRTRGDEPEGTWLGDLMREFPVHAGMNRIFIPRAVFQQGEFPVHAGMNR